MFCVRDPKFGKNLKKKKKSTGTEPIEHYNSDPVISLFGNMQSCFNIWNMTSHA